MKFKNLILVASLLAPTFSFAGERTTQEYKHLSELNALTPDKLGTDKVHYSEIVGSFTQWDKVLHNDRLALSLYPGYVEPTVNLGKTGTVNMGTRVLRVYEFKSKVLLNKAPKDIQFKGLLSLDRLQKFDPEIKHKQITSADLLLNTIAHPPVSNFSWCNPADDKEVITRPTRETNLAYTQSPAAPWKCDGEKSICVESCYQFGSIWSGMVVSANAVLPAAAKKDKGFAMQSELRFFDTQEELGLPVPLKTLTGLDTEIRGGLQQSIFYVNQVLEFGKLLVVLQKHPTDPDKTVMTAIFVLGVKQSALDEIPLSSKVMQGGIPGLNTSTGISAGLPIFTQNTVKAIAAELER